MAKKKVKEDINYNLLNIIAPSGLEFKKNSLVMSGGFGACLTISKYPTNVDYGWLAKVTQIEGVTSKLEFAPTDSGFLIERCNEQIKELKNDLLTAKDESVRQAKEKGIKDIQEMIYRINQEGETVGYLTLVLLVMAETEKKLQERIKKVNSIIASLGGATRYLTFRQKEALRWVSPFGLEDTTITDFGGRNMPLSTFSGGYVNAASGINDGTGCMIGSSEDKKPIILDTWKRGGDRTNTNWFISGVPGVGKSATVKHITESEYALGAKLIFVDPEKEYIDMVKNLGGKVINCGGGKGGIINPLQVQPAPRIDKEEMKEAEKVHGTSDLALHFQTLRTFHKLYQDLTKTENAELERVLEGTYKRFGITWETEVAHLKPTDFPIYSDLYEDLEKEYKENPSEELKQLLGKFRSIAKGADQFIFNGYTDIELDTDIIDLDISALLEADETILRSQFHNINSYVWNFIAKNREQNIVYGKDERVLYIVDEGHLLVDEKNPEALIFLKNVAKRIRKYNGGIIFTTQSMVDILSEKIKKYGQAIIDSACYKFIMGTDGQNLKETKELFDLTEAEESLLVSKQRGRGILFVGSNRIAARIEIPDEFLRIMGNAGGK
ncbi:MAG TPA: AAA family ATPase [Candidatus Scybalomonas excrementigallinarum]|nr:AAA family ATPase [Candidatus Scybalomonas excrementigallinarum]